MFEYISLYIINSFLNGVSEYYNMDLELISACGINILPLPGKCGTLTVKCFYLHTFKYHCPEYQMIL